LFSYVRHCGATDDEALDIVQSFFLHALQHAVFRRFDPRANGADSFIFCTFKRFWWRVLRKRSHEAALRVPWDDRSAVPARNVGTDILDPRLDPSEHAERASALEVAERLLATMRAAERCSAQRLLHTCLLKFILRSPSHQEYARLAQHCGTSVTTLRQRLHRLRVRFTRLLRTELGARLHSGADLDEETRAILLQAHERLTS
jgi:DNA-directed RNA polymerase specialized sigma24 family protein